MGAMMRGVFGAVVFLGVVMTPLGGDGRAMAAPVVPVATQATETAQLRATAPEGLAEGVVSGYYEAINVGDFALAYSYLGADWRARQSYNNFVQGFATTAYVYYLVTEVEDYGGFSRVTIGIEAGQKDGSVRYFFGTYTLAYEGMYFKIVAANIREG